MTVPTPPARGAQDHDADLSPTSISVPAALTDAVRHPWWTGAAACRDSDPELFFPERATGPTSQQAEQAKQVCQSCPVRTPCLAFALEEGIGFGIWGGTTPEERLAMRRTATRRRP
jgi:WhiB family transcriptional regulator, redox-sensing transcriptional regulator